MKTRKFLLLFLALTVLVTICSCDRKDPAQSETTTVATETTVAIESVETTTEPVQTTTEPVETTTQPVETTTQPVETTTQPVETTTKPVETTTKPVETTTKPVETTTKPVETTTQPVETTTKPVETTVTTGPVGPVDPEEPHEHKYTNWKTIRKATCSTSGKKVGTCTCGATKSITVAALGHTFDSEKVLTAPTCIEPGSKEVICSTCGHVEITSIPTINHTEEIIPAKAYTCTEAGMSEGKICAVCQTVLVAPEVVPAQHAFTNYVSDHNASCTVDGTETAKCDFCGNVTDTRIAVGSAKGHTPGEKLEYNNNEHYQVCTVCAVPFNAVAHDAAELCSCGYQKPAEKCQHKVTLTYVPAKASTCLAKGNSAYFICPDCSTWFEDKDATKEIVDHTKVYLEVADHVELVIVAEKPATCFEKGTTAHVICQTCEMILKQGISLPMLDHTVVIDEAVAPTCIATGKTAGEHCSVCSTVLIAQVTVPATGVHDYEIVTTPATCMANGSAVYDCKNCDAHIEEIVVATGHKIADDAVWTVVNDETTGEAIVTRKDGETCLYIGKQYTSCSVCGEKVEKEYEVVKHQHQLTATTPATCQTTGEKVYTCVCGNTYTETIEINPNAHDWTAPADNKSVCRIEGCVATKIVVDNTQSTTAGLNKDTLTGAKDNDLEVNLQDATVKMDSNIVNDLGTQGKDVELSAGKLDETGRDEVASKLNEETQKLLAEKPIFDFNLKVDNQKVEFNGKMLVTLPYTLAENEDPEHVVVAYIDDNGGVTLIPATYFEKNGEGFVSFETTHFSVFAPVVVSGADLCEVYGHKLYEVTVNATCLTAGYTNRYCSVEGCGYAELGINAVPAIGHTFVDTITPATCKSQGYTTHVCSACAYTVVDTFTPFADHAMTVTAVVAPTCMAEGYSVEKCSVCEYERKTAFVPAIDHVWGEAVVTKEETCAEQGTLTATCTYEGCTATLVSVIPAKGHVAKATEAKAPTCTEDGHTKGYVCETCGEVLVAATVLPATGHVELIIARVKPTCVAVGSTQGMSCAVCGEIIVAVEEIPMIAHQKIPFGKIDPTCTTPGYEHGEKCSMCGEIFVATVEIPALGHKEEVYAAAVAATCTETGLTEGKKCSVCGEILKKQEIIPALGHTEEVFAAAVAATCTETGLTAGTKCSVCDTVLKAQETVPATGHTEVELSAKAPTCTETGLTAGTKCSVCNTILKAQETVPTLAHTEEVFAAAVSATCTETGLTAGIKCSVCNTILKAQETVPATGHSYKNSVCSVCGNITDGYVIYEENFDEYTNSNDIEAVLHTIGWTKLTKEKDGVYNETDAEFAIIDGRLYYDNYDAKTIEGDIRVRGKDGYYQIDVLNQEYMKPFVEEKYTLQYDLEYVGAKVAARYATIITECSADGQAYNSFHFRMGGYGNHQAHFYGSWKTFDMFDPATDLYSASTATSAEEAATKGTPIIYKLLGRYCDANAASKGANLFENIPVTIKLQWEPGVGHHVYMKTADMADFVKVSEPHVDADGMYYLEKWEGYAVQFKLGATIDGYIDNIMMWVGWGEKPKSHTVAEWTIVQDPGCGKNGLKSGVCTECGETVTKSVAGIPHDVSKWEVTQEPTCTVKGKSEGVCANCGEITVRTINTLDHVHTVWETTTEATCVEKGVESSYCDYGCGTVKTRSIDVIAHKYVDGICSGCGKQGVVDGTLIFAESFNYADDSNTESVLKTIGWTKLTKKDNGVYNETDAEFAIIDGRLYYDNYDQLPLAADDTRVRGVDGYYQIDVLNQEYMKPFVAEKYTLQYELEYVDSKNISRAALLITECSADGQCYNSFMFRIGGYGNNQCHFYGSWKTYDKFEPATDLYAASTAKTAEEAATKGTPISYKLVGKYYDAEDIHMFANIKVTIKLQWEPGMGHHVYMKTADMVDFVKVSEPSLNADGSKYVGTWDGYAVQFKLAATIDGYIDNIMMWTGWGDMLLDGHYISGIWTVETESTCNTRGREYATCSKCGEKVYRELPLGKHEYTNWTVTVQPTCSAYGVEIGTCACGATETKQIEKLEHTFEGESCTLCGRGYNYDLKFTLDKNKTYYTVSGIGSCTDTEIYIPATYKNLPVLEIASSAFAKNTNITKVVIADGITTINSSAFANCTSLTKLILPETLTTCNNSNIVTSSNAYIFNVDEQGGKYLGTAENPYFLLYAAPSSSKITEYTPHADTKFIGYYSFNNCDYLQSVTIPEGVSVIANYAFRSCDSLKSVSIPSTATQIGTQLFAYCTALETVTIHADNPVYVSVNNCIINKGTKTLTVGCVSSVIPADGSVTVIGNSAFQYVPITSITVPEGVERIEAYAFRYCDALTEIVLPSTLSNLGNGVFGGCEALTSIQVAEANANFRAVDNCLIRADGALMFTATNVIPEGVTAIGPYAFYAMDSLTTVNIPTSVTSIGNYAFCNCKNLTSVVIPDSVTTIGADAFDGCNNLAEVNIPDSVTTIGSYAFYACSSLTEIVIPEGVTTITNYTFRNCSSLTTVTIPASVTKIGNYAFDGCTALTTVNYSGTAEQWSKISVGSNNAPLTNLQPVIHSYNWVVTTEPTCTQTGLETGTCGVCGATATRVIPTIAHTYTWVETAAPTCTQTGLATGTCACGATETKQLEKLEHTFVNESCTVCGRGYNYDLVFNRYKDENGDYYYSVAGIGQCTDTEIYIPAMYNDVPVREISSGAFRNNTQITKVVIPNGVTTIYNNAFGGCTNLTSLILPETLTSTYYGLANLPDAVYTVEENGGRYLGTVTNPYFLLADVLSKSQVTEFVANEATKLIGYEAFFGCNDLQSIVIPEGVLNISNYAFANCMELKTVSLPSTAVSLDNYLFAYCPALETVTVHADNPVYKSAGNCIINKESKTLVVGCVSSVIPADGSVTVIGFEAFANIPFSTFVIPEGIVEIGEWAFEGCNDLTELALPSTLTKVGMAAFNNCDFLKSFTVAAGNTTFYAVDNCLLRIADDALMVSPTGVIPSAAKAIGPYAFFNNNDLKSIVIPEGITAIDEYAFSSCYNLTSVTLPESLISIGNYAFRYCEELLAIELPGKLQSIGTRAFTNCQNLTEVIIPDSVTTMGSWIFEQCYKLEKVVLPANLTTIENGMFANCQNLKEITIPASVTRINGNAFYNCDNLTEVIIPDSVTTMDVFIFEQCDKLEKVVLPANLTTIGSGMFANCQNLKEVTIPASVIQINCDAFYNCNALTTVNYGGTTEQWAKITINGHNDPLLKAEIKAHSFTAWTQTKAPTCSEYGQETAICDDGCGMVSTRMIAKLPHTYENEACTACGAIQYSEGLEYRLSYDNNKPYYTVVGIGTCTDTKLRIPGTYEDIPVTHIGFGAIRSSTVTSVWLDKGITTLEIYAFYNCTALTEFIAADTLTSIADMALPESLKGTTVYENGLYLGSTKNPYMILTDMVDNTVTSFTIHADTKFVGDYALADAHNLESLVVPNGVLSLGRESLGYCTSLTSVTLPETLVALRPYAFRYCSALTQITLPNSLREIAYYVFEDCIALTALQIPAGVTSIEESVVSGCNALTSLTVDENNTVYHSTNNCVINTSNKALVMGCSISVIPDYVEEIYDRAFNRCDGLTSVTLPASLTKLGASAFEQCNNLTSLTVDPANSVFYSTGNCVIEKATGKLVCVAPEFVLPNDGSITSMEGWIFDHRTFEEFTLPEGLVSISQCAFQGCRNLKTLTIPASVTQIDRSAFQNCTNLTTVNFCGTESQWAAMTIESYNDHLLGANIVFNYTPQVNQ